MADEANKLRPVELKTPGLVRDRTNDLKLNKDAAQRIIARELRKNNMNPADANALSNQICLAIEVAMPMPSRPGLRNYRMISEHLGYGKRQQFEAVLQPYGIGEELADHVWKVVYSFGQPVPDDMVV